jgi:hypothetical protein
LPQFLLFAQKFDPLVIAGFRQIRAMTQRGNFVIDEIVPQPFQNPSLIGVAGITF